MSSLARCIDLIKLHPIEADKLNATAATYRKEGFDPQKSNTNAVKDAIKELESERADIISQIKKQMPEKVVSEVASKKPIQKIKEEKVEVTLEKKEAIGMAWIKNQQKPIMSARKITKGKNKGKFEIILTQGRDAEGNIIPGTKKIVLEKELVRMPEANIEEAKSRIKASTTDILKGEKGSFSIETKEGVAIFEDFSIVGKDLIQRGADTFDKFVAEMKKTFGDVWENVKHFAKEIYNRSKAILASERGAITIREKAPKPKVEKPKRGIREDINELYAKAIEIADKAKNKKEVRRLQKELEFIGGTITTPSEMRKLRQTIHAWVSYRGLTKKKLTEIVKRVTGHLSTAHKDTTADQLRKVLKQVSTTRPRIVEKKTVITRKTESRIQTLKDNLTKTNEMNEEVYQGILKNMRIKEPRYTNKRRFITETQGKEVINRMLKIAPVVKIESGIKEARKTVPGAKKVAEKIESKYEQKAKAMKKIRTYSFLDMHHFADAMEKSTGVPFGKFREVISRKRHELEYEIDKEIGKVSEGKDFKKIAQDEVAVQRINDYVTSKLPQYYKGVPKLPKNITEAEKKIANEIISGLKRKEGAVRYNRFFLWREKGVVIPNAPDVELKKATEILETQGDSTLRKWIEGRSWGVVKSGYGAEEVLNAKIRIAKRKPGFGLRGLMSRVTPKYQKQERDILKRYASYIRSITYRTELKPLIDGWVELFENNREKFADPRKVANLLTRNIKETLGEKNDMTALEEYMVRIYSQAARTIFMDIRKGVRNLFQNVAFTTDPTDLFRGEKLSKKDRKYFNIYLNQSKGIQRDWLYQEYEGIPGFSALNKIADYVNVMGRSDTANRLWAYKSRLTKVRRAIKNHPNYKTDEKEMIAMMTESKWGDVEQAERVHAIDKLATEGEDAMAREIAGSFVKKIHFLYERSERAPAEQGSELTRVLSNLFTFRKGYVQRIVLDARKLRSGVKEVESLIKSRRQAVKSLSGVMIMGAIASWIYMALTGDEREPYRPDKIIGDFSIGGLATGMQEQVGDLTRDMMSAATGDRAALGRVINGISRAGDSFIPFYDEVLHALEGLTDYRTIDKAVLRQLRSALDDRYNAKPMNYYKQGRTALESAQHIVFGTEPKGSSEIRDFQENLKEVRSADKNYNELLKESRTKAVKFNIKTKKIKRFKSSFEKASQRLSELRKRKETIAESKKYTSSEKREKTNKINIRMTKIANTQNKKLNK